MRRSAHEADLDESFELAIRRFILKQLDYSRLISRDRNLELII